jgi:peptidoglycan/LPS O-acetylase OafA/YrhL
VEPSKFLREYNKDVAVLRGLAILFVLGYHLFPGKLPWGFVGVDIFFIISGYLIAQILGDKSDRKSLFTFYINRFRRIYPALLIILVICICVGYVVLLDDEYSVLLKSTVFSLFQLQNFYEMSRAGYFVDAVNFRPLLHLWSLGVEFQFYIAFPLLLILGKRVGLSTTVVARSITLLSLFLCLILADKLGADIFFLPFTRMWELSLGATCYLITADGWRARGAIRAFLLVCSLLGAVGISLIVRSGSIYPGYTALLPTMAACSFLLARPMQEVNIRSLRPMIFIATISYSLYLWHFPIIEFARQAYGPLTVAQRFLILIASFLGAYVTDIHLIPRLLSLRRSTFYLVLGSFGILAASLVLDYSRSNNSRAIKLRNANLIESNNFNVDYKFGCEFLTGKVNKEDRCRRSVKEGETPQYVILGDSHANAFTTVFDALAVGNPEFSRYVQIGRGLCPLVPGIGDEECQALANRALVFAIQTTGPKYVVLAGQWPLYINNNSSKIQTEHFIRGLEMTLEKLTLAGKQVVFVHTVPLGALPRTCLARMPSSIAGQCDISPQMMLLRQDGYKNRIAATLMHFNVIEFDPVTSICNDIRCVVFDNGKILYLDDSHLSRSGGEYIAGIAGNWFRTHLSGGM